MGRIQEFRDRVATNNLHFSKKDLWRCLGAEFVGTFLLVFIGCGSTVHLDGTEKPTLLGTALTFGFIVMALIETIGHVSGCHINPAVTVAMLVSGKIQLVKALLYIVIQCLGAVVGIGVLKALSPDQTIPEKVYEFGFMKLADGITPLQGFGVEFMLTFVLLFIIFAVTDENRGDLKGSGSLAIGLALSALVLYGGPLTGAGMNPARAIGPCVIVGKFDNHWLYWLGPIGGAVTAAAVYQHIFSAPRQGDVVSCNSPGSIAVADMKSEKNEKVDIVNNAMPPV